jgi:hypothetical protein
MSGCELRKGAQRKASGDQHWRLAYMPAQASSGGALQSTQAGRSVAVQAALLLAPPSICRLATGLAAEKSTRSA